MVRLCESVDWSGDLRLGGGDSEDIDEYRDYRDFSSIFMIN